MVKTNLKSNKKISIRYILNNKIFELKNYNKLIDL